MLQKYSQPDSKEVDTLLKLLPYFDLDMTLKKSEKANDMRQLLGVSISETQMIEKRLSCCTLISLIGKYFDKLVSPGFQDAVINDLVVCFFQKR